MLLRDAQEQVRTLYAARRDSVSKSKEVFATHLLEARSAIEELQALSKPTWKGHNVNGTRVVGVLLLVALETANELNIDVLAALTDVLHAESP